MSRTTKKDFLDKAEPVVKDLLHFINHVGKTFGITAAKVSITLSDNQSSKILDGIIAENESGASQGIKIDIYAGDRYLSFSKNTLDVNKLKKAVLDNMKVIHLVPENPDVRLADPQLLYQGPRVDLDLFDQQQLDQNTLITYAKAAEAAGLAIEGIKKSDGVNVSQTVSHILTMATNGLTISENKTKYSVSVEMVAEDASGMQTAHDYAVVRHASQLPKPETLGINAANDALSKLNATLPMTAEMPIILSPDAAEEFFISVYSAIDGTAVYHSETFMKDKLGQQVMSADITLVDNPLIPRGVSSYQIDSAGIEAKEITFIKNGVLEQFNVSLREAKQLGIAPIGRNDGPTNSSILPGSKTPEELMADIQEGIYVRAFSGGDADVNNGVFSKPAYGHMIRNGKITADGVEGFIIAGDLQEMFMKVAIANDTPPLPSTKHTIACPTTRIDGIKIAGA